MDLSDPMAGLDSPSQAPPPPPPAALADVDTTGAEKIPGRGLWLVSFREHKAWMQLHYVSMGHYTGKVYWQGEWITANKFSETLGDTWKNWKKTVGVENFGLDMNGNEIISTPLYNNGEPLKRGKVAIEAVCESFKPPIFLKRKTWTQQARHKPPQAPVTPKSAEAHAVLQLKNELLKKDDTPGGLAGFQSPPLQQTTARVAGRLSRDDVRRNDEDDGSETEEDTPQALNMALSVQRGYSRDDRQPSPKSGTRAQGKRRRVEDMGTDIFGGADLHLPAALESSPGRRSFDQQASQPADGGSGNSPFGASYLNAHFGHHLSQPLNANFNWNSNGQQGSPSMRAPPILIGDQYKNQNGEYPNVSTSPFGDFLRGDVDKWRGKGLEVRVMDLEQEAAELKGRLADSQAELERTKRELMTSTRESNTPFVPSDSWRRRYMQWAEQGRRLFEELEGQRGEDEPPPPVPFN